MLNLRQLTLWLVLLALGVAGCASPDEEVDPIVTISNNWADEADPTHTFQFNSLDDGERAGTFTGHEQFNGSDVYAVTGSWSDGNVAFTVARPVPVRYIAPVNADNQTRFVFDSQAGQLVLAHD